MKDLNSTFIEEKNKRENSPVVLFTLFDYDDGGSNLYLTSYDTNITFDGIEYLKFPIAFETINENSQGHIDSVRVVVGNISRLIQAYLESYNLSNKKMSIKIVWANQLNDTSAYLDYTFYIDTYSSDVENVEFVLTTKMDVLDRTLPGGTYLRTHCRWKLFKDPDTCGYSGAETECNRTMQRCKELGNFERFGGFPAIPVRRIYVA